METVGHDWSNESGVWKRGGGAMPGQYHFTPRLVLAVVAMVLLFVPWSTASARLLQSPVVTANVEAIEPVPVTDMVAEPAAAACCPQPCILYRHHGRCRKVCCTCAPPVQTVLLVKDPRRCDCCPIEIPVCIPVCCTGAACVTSQRGLFGRPVVTYGFSSGFRIRIVLRLRGDVVVHTYAN